MYKTTGRIILISGAITLIQSIVVAAFLSTVLAIVPIAAAWTRNDMVFKASLAMVLTPQLLAAPLIYMVNRYRPVYILDAIGLLFVPILIPPTVFHLSQFALSKLFSLQIPSDLGAIFLVGGLCILDSGAMPFHTGFRSSRRAPLCQPLESKKMEKEKVVK